MSRNILTLTLGILVGSLATSLFHKEKKPAPIKVAGGSATGNALEESPDFLEIVEKQPQAKIDTTPLKVSTPALFAFTIPNISAPSIILDSIKAPVWKSISAKSPDSLHHKKLASSQKTWQVNTPKDMFWLLLNTPTSTQLILNFEIDSISIHSNGHHLKGLQGKHLSISGMPFLEDISFASIHIQDSSSLHLTHSTLSNTQISIAKHSQLHANNNTFLNSTIYGKNTILSLSHNTLQGETPFSGTFSHIFMKNNIVQSESLLHKAKSRHCQFQKNLFWSNSNKTWFENCFQANIEDNSIRTTSITAQQIWISNTLLQVDSKDLQNTENNFSLSTNEDIQKNLNSWAL